MHIYTFPFPAKFSGDGFEEELKAAGLDVVRVSDGGLGRIEVRTETATRDQVESVLRRHAGESERDRRNRAEKDEARALLRRVLPNATVADTDALVSLLTRGSNARP